MFCSKHAPTIVFSGIIFPQYDFIGRELQDLGDHNSVLDVLTFSFVPMENGWGFLLAWHKNSAKACAEFIRSLATISHNDGKFGDHLFRLVMSNCENLAIRPQWLDSLAEESKNSICESFSSQANREYLTGGLENISGWEFESIIPNEE